MKLQQVRMFVLASMALAWLAGCKKESDNIFNMFDVKLTLHQRQPDAAVEYNEIGANDSVTIDYTIESPTRDMFMLCLYKTGAGTPAQRIPITEDGKRRSYSGTFKFYAKDLGAGETAYRIWALDEEGVYLGDGYKTITINVLSDIKYFPNRKVYNPDTVGKVNECYVSLSDGALYSYTTGAVSSAKIDFGIYREPVYTSGNLTGYKYSLYSLSANPLPFTPYDISSWTKRETLFSAPVASNANNFRTLLSTAGKIEEEAKKRTVNLKNVVDVKTNQFVYFLTPEGKYGVFMLNNVYTDYRNAPYLNISIKIAE